MHLKYIFKEFGIGNTVAKWVNPEFITLQVLLARIVAAIIWNLITWWFGIPSSSSHTLMGGFIGAAIANAKGINTCHHAQLATGSMSMYFITRRIKPKPRKYIVFAPMCCPCFYWGGQPALLQSRCRDVSETTEASDESFSIA